MLQFMSCALGALYLKVLPYFKVWRVFCLARPPHLYFLPHQPGWSTPVTGSWALSWQRSVGEPTFPAVFPTHGSWRFSARGSCFSVTLGFDPLLWLQEGLLIFMSFWQTYQSLCFCGFSKIEFRTESVSSPEQWIIYDTAIFKGLLMTW